MVFVGSAKCPPKRRLVLQGLHLSLLSFALYTYICMCTYTISNTGILERVQDILLLSLGYWQYRHTGHNCQENEQEDLFPLYFHLESESDSLLYCTLCTVIIVLHKQIDNQMQQHMPDRTLACTDIISKLHLQCMRLVWTPFIYFKCKQRTFLQKTL